MTHGTLGKCVNLRPQRFDGIFVFKGRQAEFFSKSPDGILISLRKYRKTPPVTHGISVKCVNLRPQRFDRKFVFKGRQAEFFSKSPKGIYRYIKAAFGVYAKSGFFTLTLLCAYVIISSSTNQNLFERSILLWK